MYGLRALDAVSVVKDTAPGLEKWHAKLPMQPTGFCQMECYML